jgi:PAS domain S-box-containing protein
MTRLLKDRYFWLIVIPALLAGAFAYAPHIAPLVRLSNVEGWDPSFFVALYRLLFVVCVTITAWRFGVKWALAFCLLAGPVILGIVFADFSNPNTWLNIGVIAIGTLFGWLIGKQGRLKRLLEQRTRELGRREKKLSLEIAERKKADEKILESERRYRLLADNVTDVIWKVNVESPTRLNYVSPSITPLLGYTVEEAMDKSMEEIFSPASFENATSILEEEMAYELKRKGARHRSRRLDLELISKDGSLVDVEVNFAFIRGPDGRPVEILAVARDIAERKCMQEQLMLSDRLASVGELASGIAHELNNPLTGVIGFSQLLLDMEDIPDNIREDLNLINSEARRTASIVKNLLTFARKHTAVKQLGQLNSVIEDVLSLRAYEQKANNIEVKTRLAPNLPEIMLDYFQLQQGFLNIVVNAENAMLEAHGRGKLVVTTEKVNHLIRASFTDDGPGIAKENLKRVFDPFFTTKEVGKGTGLGLSICHGIISTHGGRMYAESKVGKGTTFVVELPIDNTR